MEKALLLFSPVTVLHDEKIRRATLRIPEVTVILRTAQSFFDRFSAKEVDLINTAGAPNEDFLAHPHLKLLIASLLQWGLYQRLTQRTSHTFDWILGEGGAHSVMNLVLERQTFSEFLWQSPALEPHSSESKDLPRSLLPEAVFQIFRRAEKEGQTLYRELGESSTDRWELVESCISKFGAERVVTVGPAVDFSEGLLRQRRLMEFDLVESVELDPQLHWFWSESRSPQPL